MPTRAACVLAALALVFAAPLLGQAGTIRGTVLSAGGEVLSLPAATLLDLGRRTLGDSDGEAAGRVEAGALHLLLIRPEKRHVLTGVFESGGRTSGTVHDLGGDLRGAFTLTRLP